MDEWKILYKRTGWRLLMKGCVPLNPDQMPSKKMKNKYKRMKLD